MRDSIIDIEIETEIRKLRRRAESLQARERKQVLSIIVDLMRIHQITAEDVARACTEAPGVDQRRRNASQAQSFVVAPKYRHPVTGETWSGRGKTPRWLAEAESVGEDRGLYLIPRADGP